MLVVDWLSPQEARSWLVGVGGDWGQGPCYRRLCGVCLWGRCMGKGACGWEKESQSLVLAAGRPRIAFSAWNCCVCSESLQQGPKD